MAKKKMTAEVPKSLDATLSKPLKKSLAKNINIRSLSRRKESKF